MTHQNPLEHFKGKKVSEHLKDARIRGARATSETHGTEMPGHFSAATDSAKTTAVLFLMLWAFSKIASIDLLLIFIVVGIGWTLWKAGRSALLGWARLERLHRIIEEERFEIEHHRQQEKEELREMYAQKGFSGELLDKVVEVLISDDNRLLRIMLEEELGLSLEIYEHPLKQSLGAGLGTLFTVGVLILSEYFWSFLGVPATSLLIIAITANLSARYEKRKPLLSVVWNLALALFSAAVVYFLTILIKP